MDISRGSARLLNHFQTWCGSKGFHWWSQERMARELECDVRTIERRIKELKFHNLIDVERRGPKSCLYRMTRQKLSGHVGSFVGSDVGSRRPYLLTEVNQKKVRRVASADVRQKPPERAANALREGVTPADVERIYERLYGGKL